MSKTRTGFALLLAALAALAAPALADEVVKTGDGGAPVAAPVSDPAIPTAAHTKDEATGAWAQRILDGEPAPPDGDEAAAAPSKCAAEAGDGRPHGEAWAAVGTRGYREVGGVVSQPIGKCGRVTVMINQSQGGIGVPRGRR